MAEVAFLTAVRDFLASTPAITPAAALVGFAQPEQGDGFPVMTLSLATVERVDIGMSGGLTEVSDGALHVVSTIDLANPVLEGTEGFSLLDPGRTGLSLLHGGLVREDRLGGALGPTDLVVTVDGAPMTMVADSPAAGEYSVEPLTGHLTFGAALPATGTLVAHYFLGIWERATTLIRGELDLTTWDDDTARLIVASDQATRALLAAPGGALSGLQKIGLRSLGPIGEAQEAQPRGRPRTARFAFEYEHIVDLPLSSGGVIVRVATTSELAAFHRDPNTGAMVETVVIETEDE